MNPRQPLPLTNSLRPRGTIPALTISVLKILLLSAVAVLTQSFWPLPARSQDVKPNSWIADGLVTTIVPHGNVVYVGGDFRSIGPNTGGGAALDYATGNAIVPFPHIEGDVAAALSDGEGGWFIGGGFTSVGGLPRCRLAHVLADGTVTDWAPSIASGAPYALVRIGDVIYIGGIFYSVNGAPQRPCRGGRDHGRPRSLGPEGHRRMGDCLESGGARKHRLLRREVHRGR